MAIEKLDAQEIENRLDQLHGWTLADGKLHRDLKFADFVAAFSFMTGVALAAEAMGHHPAWHNVYNRVHIDLSTHDAGGITVKDFELASRIDRLAAS